MVSKFFRTSDGVCGDCGETSQMHDGEKIIEDNGIHEESKPSPPQKSLPRGTPKEPLTIKSNFIPIPKKEIMTVAPGLKYYDFRRAQFQSSLPPQAGSLTLQRTTSLPNSHVTTSLPIISSPATVTGLSTN